MNLRSPGSAVLLLITACGVLFPSPAANAASPLARSPAPEFTHNAAQDWINSPPLRLADLRGKVVLLDIWTFDCWNCYRSFPWLNDLEKRLEPEGLRVIGVHTPEFKHEHERAAVERKVAEFKLHHPVMMDNDFSYWRALGNRYWPAFYIVDKHGVLRETFIGETHIGDARAQRIEALLLELLAETGP